MTLTLMLLQTMHSGGSASNSLLLVWPSQSDSLSFRTPSWNKPNVPVDLFPAHIDITRRSLLTGTLRLQQRLAKM